MNDIATIRLLKAMLKAANKSETYHSRNATGIVEDVRNKLREIRKKMRERPNPMPGWVTTRERSWISHAIQDLLNERSRTHVDIEFGKAMATYKGKTTTYGSSSRLNLVVGHMWHRRVFKNLYKGERFVNAKDYLILSATEYKTNVRNIKLWKVMVFSFNKKKTIEGYIGQSAFDKMPCTFRLDMHGAIKAAIKLTANAVSEKLGLEK